MESLADDAAAKKEEETGPGIAQIWQVREMFINIAGVALITGIIIL